MNSAVQSPREATAPNPAELGDRVVGDSVRGDGRACEAIDRLTKCFCYRRRGRSEDAAMNWAWACSHFGCWQRIIRSAPIKPRTKIGPFPFTAVQRRIHDFWHSWHGFAAQRMPFSNSDANWFGEWQHLSVPYWFLTLTSAPRPIAARSAVQSQLDEATAAHRALCCRW